MPAGSQLFIPVLSSPFAAMLAASGVANWLTKLGSDVTGRRIDVEIANRGDAIVINTSSVLAPEHVRTEHFASSLPWIKTAKNGAPPPGLRVADYEAEKQHNSAYYEELKRLNKQGRTLAALDVDARNALEQRAPRAEWPVFALINQVGGLAAYNKAVERWSACRDVYPELAAIIWKMCSGDPGAVVAAQVEWETLAKKHSLEKSALLSATQIVNPEQGKGANRTKADALSIGGQESFWLLEYFKFVGLYEAALPRTVQGTKDRKTYVVVPAPNGINLDWHTKIFRQFQKEFWSGNAISMDIQAVLRYTAAMLTQWQAAQVSRGRRRRVSDFVDGFIVATYKDLGSAVAMMNIAMIRLPDWIEWPKSVERAKHLAEVIREHQSLTRALDEKKGEEEYLLRAYRDFISSRDPALHAFFNFTQSYAGHVIRKLSRRERAPQLLIEHVETIIMANDERRQAAGMLPLKPILDTPGFRRVATAIRQSTVEPQYRKVRGDDNPYEVRYGLADELRRRSRDNREFIQALSEFLQKYSQENGLVMERLKDKPYRRRIPISTDDIVQVAELVDIYNAPTVANLLLAFGYAREARTTDAGSGDGAPNGETLEPPFDQDEVSGS